MSTLETRDVLNGISEACSMIVYFLYLEFDENKYLKNWGNYEVLRMELGGFIVTIFFFFNLFMKVCNFGISLYLMFCICLSQSCF